MTDNMNGGASTINEFLQYDKDTQKKILRFIQNFLLYDEIEVSGKPSHCNRLWV